jgi:hypothetical protein
LSFPFQFAAVTSWLAPSLIAVASSGIPGLSHQAVRLACRIDFRIPAIGRTLVVQDHPSIVDHDMGDR